MKRCSRCGQEKEAGAFNRRSASRDGLQHKCKMCERELKQAHYAVNGSRIKAEKVERRRENVEAMRQRERELYHQRKEAIRARKRKWYEGNRNKEAVRRQKFRSENPDYWQSYYEANKDAYLAVSAKRRAGLEQRACLLTPEDEKKIKALYGFARYLTEKFGQPYHVDHIVPLHGETCSGLHHPDNLRVVPAQLNLSKGNKIDYELVPHAFRPEEN